MGLLDVIKRAAVDAVSESGPAAVYFGVVKGLDPPLIAVSGSFELGRDLLLFTEQGASVRPGDSALLLRAGGRFIVLGRMV
jgi:hypothetical protein